jgi:hypothetical protein
LILIKALKAVFRVSVQARLGSRKQSMLKTRYKKLTGMHAGHSYIVIAPYSEVENPMRWMLHSEANADEKQIVAEDELSDRKLWQPLT